MSSVGSILSAISAVGAASADHADQVQQTVTVDGKTYVRDPETGEPKKDPKTGEPILAKTQGNSNQGATTNPGATTAQANNQAGRAVDSNGQKLPATPQQMGMGMAVPGMMPGQQGGKSSGGGSSGKSSSGGKGNSGTNPGCTGPGCGNPVDSAWGNFTPPQLAEKAGYDSKGSYDNQLKTDLKDANGAERDLISESKANPDKVYAVTFSMTGCTPCNQLEGHLKGSEGVTSIPSKFDPQKAEMFQLKDSELASQFGVPSYPTTVLIKGGEVVGEPISGYAPSQIEKQIHANIAVETPSSQVPAATSAPSQSTSAEASSESGLAINPLDGRTHSVSASLFTSEPDYGRHQGPELPRTDQEKSAQDFSESKLN